MFGYSTDADKPGLKLISCIKFTRLKPNFVCYGIGSCCLAQASLVELVHSVYFGHTYNVAETCTQCGQRRDLVATLRVCHFTYSHALF